MKDKNNTWLISLGYLPVPKDWYISNTDEVHNDDKIKPIKTIYKKLTRAILALIRNKGNIHRDNIYLILKERGFLPIIDGTHFMKRSRFVAYYYKVIRDNNIVRDKPKTLKQNVLESMSIMTIDEMAIKFNSSKKSVKEVIYNHKKEIMDKR